MSIETQHEHHPDSEKKEQSEAREKTREELREELVASSQQLVDDFKQQGETNLSEAEKKAEAAGIAIDPHYETTVQELHKEADNERWAFFSALYRNITEKAKGLFSKKQSEASASDQSGLEVREKYTPDPFFEKFLDTTYVESSTGRVKFEADTYNGNEAVTREDWLDKNNLNVISCLAKLHVRDPQTYPKEKLYAAKEMISDMRDNRHFDLGLVNKVETAKRKERYGVRVFTRTVEVNTRDDIVRSIASGGFKEFDESYIRSRVGDTEFDRVREITQRQQQREKEKQERLNIFKSEGRDTESLLIHEGSLTLIETHADRVTEGSLQRIKERLPETLKSTSLRIDFQEKADSVVKEGEGDARVVEDASGRLSDEILREYIKPGEKSVIVLTGGNLRGCAGATFESLMKYAGAVKPHQVDVHIPLDECYDSNVYDEYRYKLPTKNIEAQTSDMRYETYHDGDVKNVSTDYANDSLPRIRLYTWSRADEFTQKISEEYVKKGSGD